MDCEELVVPRRPVDPFGREFVILPCSGQSYCHFIMLEAVVCLAIA